ncbi:MAG: hypothetical protein GY810_05585 [Aureispira sp.]|nr:hypothetical protein [Aureispira sp.]
MEEILNELLDEKKIKEVYDNLDNYDINDLRTLRKELEYLVSDEVKEAYPKFNLEDSERFMPVANLYQAIQKEGVERQGELDIMWKEETLNLNDIIQNIERIAKVIAPYIPLNSAEVSISESKREEYKIVRDACKEFLEERVVFLNIFDNSIVPSIKKDKTYKKVAKEIRGKRDEFIATLRLAEKHIEGGTPLDHLEEYNDDKEVLEIFEMDPNPKKTKDIDAPDFSMKAINHKDAKNKFNQGIINWAGNLRDSLNYLHDEYSRAEKPPKLSVADFVDVLALIPKVGVYIAAAKTVYTTIATMFEKLKTSSATNISDLHRMWETKLKEYIQKQDYSDEYEAFKQDFEKKYTEKYTLENVEKEILLFLQQLPVDEIRQNLVGTLLNSLEDSLDTDDYAGVAEVDLLFVINDKFKVPSGSIGQIDDADEKLIEAMKVAFEGKRVIDLPIPIIITVTSTQRGGEVCQLKRTSKKPGSLDFKVISGKKIYLERFIRGKAYDLLKVKDLVFDD